MRPITIYMGRISGSYVACLATENKPADVYMADVYMYVRSLKYLAIVSYAVEQLTLHFGTWRTFQKKMCFKKFLQNRNETELTD